MLQVNSKSMRWQAACSKSLLMVFIAQLLLSAACISTANADVLTQKYSATAHCHNEAMASHMGHMGDTHNDMPACSHCDIPDMGLSAHTSVSMDMNLVLLAIIEFPDMPVLHALGRATSIQQRAPPHRFTLLHHTNQRILI